MSKPYDIIIIGSGAGGGTMAHALASTGANILVLERGDFVPSEPENWNPESVWKQLRYRTKERWLDQNGNAFSPYTHYCVGGNTKFWGSVLYRLRKTDFEETSHVDGMSPAWPISYSTLAPYYDRAERLYEVHGTSGEDPTEESRGPFPYPAIPHSDFVANTIEGLLDQGLHPSALPLGLRSPSTAGGCILCNTCNSFPCKIHAKSESDTSCLRPLLKRDNVSLWTNTLVKRLLTSPNGTHIEAVEAERDGETLRITAPLVIVSCGAVNSAALLLCSENSKHPHGLGNSSGLVGKRYMSHLATMMQGFHPFRRNNTVFQKTVAINDFYFRGPHSKYPLGQLQAQGRTHGVMAQTVVPWIPLWAYNAWVARGMDWLAMTEDLPRPENKITVTSTGQLQLHYRPNNVSAHNELVTEMRQILRRLGYWKIIIHSHNEKNTTHQCGTLSFGHHSTTSVLDTYCRSHDVENLFVVDGSFFPSSAAVNPGLTIAAQALRVADHIIQTDLRTLK